MVAERECRGAARDGVVRQWLRPSVSARCEESVMIYCIPSDKTTVDSIVRIADVELEFVTGKFRTPRICLLPLFVSFESVDVG